MSEDFGIVAEVTVLYSLTLYRYPSSQPACGARDTMKEFVTDPRQNVVRVFRHGEWPRCLEVMAAIRLEDRQRLPVVQSVQLRRRQEAGSRQAHIQHSLVKLGEAAVTYPRKGFLR